MSGYMPCACRDCFEIAIGEQGAFCNACESAGCEPDSECSCEHEPEESELPQVELCSDCTQYACYDELSPDADDEQIEATRQGVASLGHIALASREIEHSIDPCGACRSRLHGHRQTFVRF